MHWLVRGGKRALRGRQLTFAGLVPGAVWWRDEDNYARVMLEWGGKAVKKTNFRPVLCRVLCSVYYCVVQC